MRKRGQGHPPCPQTIGKIMKCLGDPHNFGRRVYLENGRIVKPRNMLWEWLFLSTESPLRQRMVKICSSLPNLHFQPSKTFFLEGGSVEQLKTRLPKQNELNLDHFQSVGQMIAILIWFGISDLHVKNVCFGMDKNSRFVFCPIDIECILNHLVLPSQTHLLPSSSIGKKNCGLYEIKKYLLIHNAQNAVGAICRGYINALEFLTANKELINNVLISMRNIDRAPIRMILKPTKIYYGAMQGHRADNPIDFLECEKEQMERGDIPYFFRTIQSDELFFFKEENKLSKVKIAKAISKNVTPIKNFDGLRFSFEDNNTILKAGVLQLAKYLDKGKSDLEIDYKNVYLRYSQSDIFLKLKNKMAITCSRGQDGGAANAT